MLRVKSSKALPLPVDTGFYNRDRLAISPDSTLLAVRDEGGDVFVFDTATWATEFHYQQDGTNGPAQAFSADGTRFAFAVWDASYQDYDDQFRLKVYQVGTWSELADIRLSSQRFSRMQFAADDSFFVMSAEVSSNNLEVFSGSTYDLIETFSLEGTGGGVAITPDKQYVVVGVSSEPYLRVIRTSDWSIVTEAAQFSGTEARTVGIDVSPDGKYVAMAADGYDHLIDVATWQQIPFGPEQPAWHAAVFDSTSKYLLRAADGSGEIGVFPWDDLAIVDLSTQEAIEDVPDDVDGTSWVFEGLRTRTAVFSPDGKKLYTAAGPVYEHELEYIQPVTTCALWGSYQRTYETCTVADTQPASFRSFEHVYSGSNSVPTMHDITGGADDPINNPVTDDEAVYVDVASQDAEYTGSEHTMQIVVRNPSLLPIDNVRQQRRSDGSQAGELAVTVDIEAESTILIEALLYGSGSEPWEIPGSNELIILYDVDGVTYSIEHDLCVNCF